MNEAQHSEENFSVLAPIWQLFMILAPTVANAFLLVYALLGAVLEGEQKLGWNNEAVSAGSYIAAGVVLFCLLMIALLRLAGRPARHPLAIVNWVQCALAAVFLLAILIIGAI